MRQPKVVEAVTPKVMTMMQDNLPGVKWTVNPVMITRMINQ